MKKYIYTFIISTVLIVYFIMNNNNYDNKKNIISFVQIADHAAFDYVYDGMMQELKNRGYLAKDNIKITRDSARADIALALQIAKNKLQNYTDKIAFISVGSTMTNAAISVSNADIEGNKWGEIPIISSSITKGAIKGRAKNYTGVYDDVNKEQQLSKMFNAYNTILPDNPLKRIGILYNPGDANVDIHLKYLEQFIKKFNKKNDCDIKLILKTITKTSEIPGATKSVINEGAQTILVDMDNMVLSAFGAIVIVATNNKIPIMCSDNEIIQEGALITCGPDQFYLGKVLADKLIKIIDGTKANDIPMLLESENELYLNSRIAKKLGLTIPVSAIKMAKKVFE